MQRYANFYNYNWVEENKSNIFIMISYVLLKTTVPLLLIYILLDPRVSFSEKSNLRNFVFGHISRFPAFWIIIGVCIVTQPYDWSPFIKAQ